MRAPLRRTWLLAGVSLLVAAAFVACSINPQPLPPGDLNASPEGPSSEFAEGGRVPTYADAGSSAYEPEDAGAAPPTRESDASDEAGDAGSDGGALKDAPTDG